MAADQSDNDNSGIAPVVVSDAPVSAAKGGEVVERLWAYGRQIGFHRQRDLAQHLGVTEETIRKWRLNLSDPSISLLERIASRTPMRREWLLYGQGEMLAEAALPAVGGRGAAQLVRLQDQVALEDLVVAYESAHRHFAARGVTAPEPRKLLGMMLALYDAAMQVVQEEEAPRPAPIVPPES